jgi:predicted O-linked N-acetylglucosamine transferase (SPINDLY family)
VLWLSQDNVDASENLRRAAAARGIEPARLLFAPRLDLYEDHLARHRLADLFLDTLPYNAHATASDALWAGLPLLTCRGASFAGRVATSLLQAAGLPELVTNDLGAYEASALRLATDAPLLRGFRQRLAQNRATCPLFDTDRLRRHVERAYATMWGLQQRGERPASFSVESER